MNIEVWCVLGGCRKGGVCVCVWWKQRGERDDVLVCEVAGTHSGLGGGGGGVWCLVARGGDLRRQPAPWSIQPPTNHTPQHNVVEEWVEGWGHEADQRRMGESIRWSCGWLQPIKTQDCMARRKKKKKKRKQHGTESEPLVYMYKKGNSETTDCTITN